MNAPIQRRQILFVDDEPRVLLGLQNSLRAKRQEWNMVFAEGPDAALEELGRGSFDIIITDMRMPKMDGAALLAEVQRRHPAVIRVVLSGQTDPEMAKRAVSVAHLFLAKPCPADTLRAVVQRACDLQASLSDPALRAFASGLDQLPAIPSVYIELRTALESTSSSLEDISQIVEGDPGLTAKLLQLASSAFFGLGQRSSSVAHAIRYLGLDVLRSTYFLLQASQQLALAPGALLEFQRRAIATARLGKRIAPSSVSKEEVFTAGMLAGIGRLLLLGRGKERFDPPPDHAQLGAYLLGVWNLPYAIVEAVALHNKEISTFEPGAVAGVVHVSDRLIERRLQKLELPPIADVELSRLGFTSNWRELDRAAREELERAGGESHGK